MDERTKSLIKMLYKKGAGYNRIAALVGVTRYAVVKVANPEQHEKERQRNKAWKSRPDAGNIYETKRNAHRRLMADIPEDTRTVSQRLMGEPLPGRSALDQKQGEVWRPKSVAVEKHPPAD